MKLVILYKQRIIQIPVDIFTGLSSTPLFKKGESFLKALNKINQLLTEIDPKFKIDFESNSYFKEYSRLNLPSKNYKLTFSSDGPDGAWDIATASMRGIASCQSWTSAQSRGLIGSIASKYVGIAYVSGDSNYQPYGKQMIFRSIVRLIINKITGTPALYLDKIYPHNNTDIFHTVRNILETKSGIKVLAFDVAGNRDTAVRDYYVLNEESRSFLREGEYSYMDTPIPIENRRVPIFTNINSDRLVKRREYFTQKICDLIRDRKIEYII